MEVLYTLTRDDSLGFQRFHTHRKGKLRWFLSATNIIERYQREGLATAAQQTQLSSIT